jgi:type VI secretion system secreted protein VgrG
VSRCFRFEVELLSDDARIPLKTMMARMVTISLVREDGSLRYFNGYVTEFRFLRTAIHLNRFMYMPQYL